MIEDKKTGYLFPSGDAQALASVIRQAHADRAVAAEMRNYIRNLFMDLYAPDKNAEQLSCIYSQVLEKA